MAKESPVRLALLSVHPEYAEALVNGTKKVEFRKRALAADVTHVAIYATRPVGRVVGVFSIDEQVVAEPGELWRQFSKVAGISRPRFFEYYDGLHRGVGIRVKSFLGLEGGMTLEDALGISRPPQGTQYFSISDPGHRLAEALAAN